MSAVKIIGAVTGLLLGLFVFKVSYIFNEGKTQCSYVWQQREVFIDVTVLSVWDTRWLEHKTRFMPRIVNNFVYSSVIEDSFPLGLHSHCGSLCGSGSQWNEETQDDGCRNLFVVSILCSHGICLALVLIFLLDVLVPWNVICRDKACCSSVLIICKQVCGVIWFLQTFELS